MQWILPRLKEHLRVNHKYTYTCRWKRKTKNKQTNKKQQTHQKIKSKAKKIEKKKQRALWTFWIFINMKHKSDNIMKASYNNPLFIYMCIHETKKQRKQFMPHHGTFWSVLLQLYTGVSAEHCRCAKRHLQVGALDLGTVPAAYHDAAHRPWCLLVHERDSAHSLLNSTSGGLEPQNKEISLVCVGNIFSQILEIIFGSILKSRYACSMSSSWLLLYYLIYFIVAVDSPMLQKSL